MEELQGLSEGGHGEVEAQLWAALWVLEVGLAQKRRCAIGGRSGVPLVGKITAKVTCPVDGSKLSDGGGSAGVALDA